MTHSAVFPRLRGQVAAQLLLLQTMGGFAAVGGRAAIWLQALKVLRNSGRLAIARRCRRVRLRGRWCRNQ